MKNKKPNACFSTQTGFTLLEVLVSVLILGLALLGLAALQGNSLKYNNAAYRHSQATTFANEMIDRLRSNLTAIMPENSSTGAKFNDTDYSKNLASFYHGMAYLDNANKTNTSCDSSKPGCPLAKTDFTDWNQQISQLLPVAQWRICNTNQNDANCETDCDSANTSSTIHTVTICWQEGLSDENAANQKEVNITVQL